MKKKFKRDQVKKKFISNRVCALSVCPFTKCKVYKFSYENSQYGIIRIIAHAYTKRDDCVAINVIRKLIRIVKKL